MAALEKPIGPRFLSVQERELSRDLQGARTSIRAIARTLGKSPSTITANWAEMLIPGWATCRTSASESRCPAARPKTAKLIGESDLREYVKDKLLLRWSQEQISHTLAEEFPNKPEMRVSPEAIYQALYVQARADSNAKYRLPCAPAGPGA